MLVHARRSVPVPLPPLQGLLKKHEAFETDFTVHKDRVNDVCTNGQDLVKKVSLAPRETQVSDAGTPTCGHLSCPPALIPRTIAKALHEASSSATPVFHEEGRPQGWLVSPF